jgi:hypothetical protein
MPSFFSINKESAGLVAFSCEESKRRTDVNEGEEAIAKRVEWNVVRI